MKKYILTAAVAFSALMAGQAYAQQKYVFALVPKNMNNPFFDQARDGCKKAEAESSGAIECMYIGPGEHGGGEEQVQIVQDLVAKKVDGIAVAPSNAAAMAVALQAAKEAGIPVLTWDSDVLPENKDLRVAYIGSTITKLASTSPRSCRPSSRKVAPSVSSRAELPRPTTMSA
ncbi:substrate-binding domain-containing protein [Mesorhizobium sp. M0598]